LGEDGAGGDGGAFEAAVTRAEAVERRGLRRRGAPLFLPGVTHPLFLEGWREEQQGEEGGKGGGGEYPLFMPE
jgi:hypothetical protein